MSKKRNEKRSLGKPTKRIVQLVIAPAKHLNTFGNYPFKITLREQLPLCAPKKRTLEKWLTGLFIQLGVPTQPVQVVLERKPSNHANNGPGINFLCQPNGSQYTHLEIQLDGQNLFSARVHFTGKLPGQAICPCKLIQRAKGTLIPDITTRIKAAILNKGLNSAPSPEQLRSWRERELGLAAQKANSKQ